MKKILIVSTVSRQFFLFEKGNIDVLKSLGYEVHAAANFNDSNDRLNALDIIKHPFDIQRSPLSLKNIIAYNQLKKIMNLGNFDAVHCHSPMGGILARLAANSIGISPVIYTAHGFHFFKGAPIINWLLYYPVEKFMSKITDTIITINNEDYERAKAFKAKHIEYIPGVGIDTEKFNVYSRNKIEKRNELGIPLQAFVVLSVGELNKNKNHRVIIEALSKIDKENIYYVICGQGPLLKELKSLSKKVGLEKRIKFLGYRNDIHEIHKAADVFAFPSKREGLGLSALEAMASGLPIITSNIHGIVDYSVNGKTGYSCCPTNKDGFADAILKLFNNEELRIRMGEENKKAVKQYDIANSKKKMEKIYSEVLSHE
jgi:glycosyltransferase involved in cell wall biosynthesis